MLEPIRQWFFHRVSEPLIAWIQVQFGPGPLKAVAIAELGIAAAQWMIIITVGGMLWRLQIVDVPALVSGQMGKVIAVALSFYLGAAPLLLAYQLFRISEGTVSALGAFACGIAQSRVRTFWRYIPFDLLWMALIGSVAVIPLAFGIWQGVFLILAIASWFPLECLKGAIWHNVRLRGLVAASAPARY